MGKYGVSTLSVCVKAFWGHAKLPQREIENRFLSSPKQDTTTSILLLQAQTLEAEDFQSRVCLSSCCFKQKPTD